MTTRPHPRRLLVVEDDHAMLGLLAHHFRLRGFAVTGAHDSKAALARMADMICRRTNFDLLISDIRMPGASGLELVAELRRSAWMAPVVLITGFGNQHARDEARALGAAFMDKPVDLDALTATVEKLLA